MPASISLIESSYKRASRGLLFRSKVSELCAKYSGGNAAEVDPPSANIWVNRGDDPQLVQTRYKE